MTDDERRAFLTDGTRTGKLATVRADGRPHAAPVWFVLDDQDRLVITTGANSVKGKNIRRDPRVAMVVDDETPPYSFVSVEGIAEISEDLEEMLHWATVIGGRYMGADRAEAFGKRNAVPGELLVKIKPTHSVAIRNLAD